MKYTKLTFKEIYPDLTNSGAKKKETLNKHLSSLITSRQLPHGYELKSISIISKMTSLSFSSIIMVLDDLRLRGYLIRKNGSVSIVNFIEGVPVVELIDYLHVDSHHKAIWQHTAGLNNYFHTAEEKHRLKHSPSVQNSIYTPLISTCCNLVNEMHGTNYNQHSMYYVHDGALLMVAIAKIMAKKRGGVIIPKQSARLKAILRGEGIKVYEVGFDNMGLLMHQVQVLCEQHTISAVFLMSRANFPNALDTSKERIAILHNIRNRYKFKIVDSCGFEPWLKNKENYVLTMAGAAIDEVIYISPLTPILEEMGHLFYVAANPSVIRAITKYIDLLSSNRSQSIAYAANEVLLSRIYVNTVKRFDIALMPLVAQINSIFRSAGFWEPAGIRNENGAAIYLVPKKGAFMNDVFEQLYSRKILAVPPEPYWNVGDNVIGVRLDGTPLIGKKSAEASLKELDRVLREMVRLR